MQQKDNISREFEMQPDTQQPDNTSQQFLVQSTMEVPKNTSQQSQTQPETTYIAELEAKNASLQAENDLLKSSKLVNPNVYEMMCENQLLKIDLEKAKECIQILLEQIEEKDQENAMLRTEGEKEIDRKGKKVAEKVKSVICFTRKDTNEVLSAMPISDSSDDSDGGGGETEDEDEDDVGKLRALMKMKMFNGKVGSSSKTGSGLETDCVMSNGEVEKTIINGENNQWVSKPLWSESDLIPNFLKSDEIASQGKMLYGHNNKEVSKLAGSSETGSSSCQMGLPPDDMKSKSTTNTPERKKLNESDAKSALQKRKWGVYWGSEEDMLCYLTSKPEMLLEAVCALYRLERQRRLCKFKRMPCNGLSDSDYQRLMYVTTVLTEGDMYGPNKKTTEELEMYLGGSLDFCGRLVGTYSALLFQIYCKGLDLHFC